MIEKKKKKKKKRENYWGCGGGGLFMVGGGGGGSVKPFDLICPHTLQGPALVITSPSCLKPSFGLYGKQRKGVVRDKICPFDI